MRRELTPSQTVIEYVQWQETKDIAVWEDGRQ